MSGFHDTLKIYQASVAEGSVTHHCNLRSVMGVMNFCHCGLWKFFVVLCLLHAVAVAHPLLQRLGHNTPMVVARCPCRVVVHATRDVPSLGQNDGLVTVSLFRRRDDGPERFSSHHGLPIPAHFPHHQGEKLSLELRESSGVHGVHRRFERDFQGDGVFIIRLQEPLVRLSKGTVLISSRSTSNLPRQEDTQCPVFLPQHPPVSLSTTTRTSTLTPTSRFHSSQYRNALKFTSAFSTAKHFILPSVKESNEVIAPVTKTTARIIGGVESGPDLAKYLVSFQTSKPSSTGNSSSTCTGTLVGPSTVITAGHCNLTTNTIAMIGSTDAREGVVYNVQSVTNHPQYDSKDPERDKFYGVGSFDVAFVTLSGEVPQSDGGTFMKVNANPEVPVVGSVVRIAGYGFLSKDDVVSPDRLHQADMIVSDPASCAEKYEAIDEVVNTSRVVCASEFENTNCSPCTADSGGPLFQYDEDNNPVLVGIIIRGKGCSTKTVPALFARTSANFDVFPINLQWTSSTAALTVSEDGSTTDAPSPSPFTIPDKQSPLASLSPIPATPSYSPIPSASPFAAPGKSIGGSPSRVTIILASVSAALVVAAILAIITALLRR